MVIWINIIKIELELDLTVSRVLLSEGNMNSNVKDEF